MFFRKTAKEQVKESQRVLAGDIRELDREITELRREEVKLIADIRASGNAGNAASTKVLAQQLVRLRGHLQRIAATKAQLQGVSSNLSAAAASTTMAASLQNAGKAMAAVGVKVDAKQQQQQIQQFARADFAQQLAQEMVGDGLDLALNDEDDEGQAQELVQQVMEEVGLELAASLKAAPGTRVAAPVPVRVSEADDDELMLRLAKLKA